VSGVKQWLNHIILEPLIRDGTSRKCAVVPVIAKVRGDERVIWQHVCGKIVGEAQIRILESYIPVQTVALHVRNVGNRAVPNGVLAAVTPEIAGARQTFRITLPRLASCPHFPNNVIAGIRESAGIRIAAVVVSRDHAPAQVVVVADGRVSRRVVVSRKAALGLEAAQKRHASVVRAAHIGVVGVLFQHDNHVLNLGNLSEGSFRRDEE
jgi:hypothetical protein